MSDLAGGGGAGEGAVVSDLAGGSALGGGVEPGAVVNSGDAIEAVASEAADRGGSAGELDSGRLTLRRSSLGLGATGGVAGGAVADDGESVAGGAAEGVG